MDVERHGVNIRRMIELDSRDVADTRLQSLLHRPTIAKAIVLVKNTSRKLSNIEVFFWKCISIRKNRRVEIEKLCTIINEN